MAGESEDIGAEDPGRPGARPSGGPKWSYFRSLPTQAWQSPVTLSYTANTHPFDLQAVLGGRDPQDAPAEGAELTKGLALVAGRGFSCGHS